MAKKKAWKWWQYVLAGLVILLVLALLAVGSYQLGRVVAEEVKARETGQPIPTRDPIIQAMATTLAEVVAPTPVPTEAPTPTSTPTPLPPSPTPSPTVTAQAGVTKSTIPPGFTPDPNLIKVGGIRGPAEDVSKFTQFPDIPYAAIGNIARAGYRYGYNDWCGDEDFVCSLQLPAWHWLVITGEEIYLPSVGSLKDPDGGAVLVLILNRSDSDFAWTEVYTKHGFFGTGRVWDMSNEQFTLETQAILRDHYLYNLSGNIDYVGQCGSSKLCATVTWITVQRWFDGSWRLTGHGQWKK